jgi:hypothetical protein
MECPSEDVVKIPLTMATYNDNSLITVAPMPMKPPVPILDPHIKEHWDVKNIAKLLQMLSLPPSPFKILD